MFLRKVLESKETFSNSVRMRKYIKQLIDLVMDKTVESYESSEEEDS